MVLVSVDDDVDDDEALTLTASVIVASTIPILICLMREVY